MSVGFFDKIRFDREILTNSRPACDFLTVYIGIYNGEKYLPEIKNFLKESNWQDSNLIVVDNASTDASWNEIVSWRSFLKMPYKLVKNPVNLGGSGGFELNKDLVDTEWITFIHQDDIYSAEHMSVLSKAAKKSESDVIIISTEMGSIDENGKEKFSIPRPIWLLKDTSAESYFLSNLRTHLVPWGSSFFRSKEYLSVELAWHSTAFPDTEILLKLCSLGRFINLPIQTMLYRESPISESHGLGNSEKEIAAVAALARVFSSAEFRNLAQQMHHSRRDEFLEAVKDGIKIRIGSASLSKIVELIAEESLLIAWNYSQSSILKSLGMKYEELNAERVTELLNRILSHETCGIEKILSSKSANQEIVKSKTTQGIISKRVTLEWLLRFLPYRHRRYLLRSLLKIKVYLNRNHPNRFNW